MLPQDAKRNNFNCLKIVSRKRDWKARVGTFTAILTAFLVVSSCTPVYSATPMPINTATASATAFQPQTHTPTITPSPSPTPDPSVTPTLTPRATSTERPAGPIDMPILLYHHIAENSADKRYYISPDMFARQMQWLSDHGYQTITEARLAEVIRHGGILPERPMIITFDDGNSDFFEGAFPVMSKLNMVGVAFLVTERIDIKGFVTSDQVKAMIDAGWEIGSHSVSHPDLLRPRANLSREILGSKDWLDKKYGINVVSFAYPFGLTNAAVSEFVANNGYTSAADLGARLHQSEANLYALSRIEVWGNFTMDQFTAFMPWQ